MLNVPAGRILRFAPALAAAAAIVAVSCLTRVFLALRPDVAVTWGFADWLGIFGFGLLFDAVAALYLVAPLVLWLALAPDRIARSRLHRASMVLAVFAFAYLALFLAVAEWLFWDEFFSRFNFIAVDYLIYTTEVLGNIRQSYPVGTILLALLLPAEAVAKVRAALEEDGGRLLSPSGDGFERKMSSGRPERRLNAVLISVESLGAEFLGVYGNRHGLTPYLDKLSRESLWFSRVYSSGNRTVRGMEALALALPPPPGQSIVRRPNNAGLFSLGSVFDRHGYTSVFAYGGYGYFDNMN